MHSTFAQKVLARAAGRETVTDGEIVTVRPRRLLMHDNTAAIIAKIGEELDRYGVAERSQPVIVLDHVAPARDTASAGNHQKIRTFVERFGIEHFHDVGAGICHQVVLEEGLAAPGDIIVGSDSHTCSYGAVNAFATGIDRTEAAALLLTGETWLKVPPTIAIVLSGELPPAVTAKDLILTVIGRLGADGAAYRAVEFSGAVAALSVPDRITVANMGIEMGAKIAVFPVDAATRAYLAATPPAPAADGALWSDPDARFESRHEVDLAALVPVVARPGRVDDVVAVGEAAGTRVDQVLLGTCTNGRLPDLHAAAALLTGRRIAPGVRLLVLPASRRIYEAAARDGTLADLAAAGATVLPPGCGPCLGAHLGVPAPGEVCLSTANRNFRGRMGTPEAEIWLAGPTTAAAAALTGVITDPREITPRPAGTDLEEGAP